MFFGLTVFFKLTRKVIITRSCSLLMSAPRIIQFWKRIYDRYRLVHDKTNIGIHSYSVSQCSVVIIVIFQQTWRHYKMYHNLMDRSSPLDHSSLFLTLEQFRRSSQLFLVYLVDKTLEFSMSSSWLLDGAQNWMMVMLKGDTFKRTVIDLLDIGQHRSMPLSMALWTRNPAPCM